jgi:hypothetical protein
MDEVGKMEVGKTTHAVGRTRRETGVALAADLLVALDLSALRSATDFMTRTGEAWGVGVITWMCRRRTHVVLVGKHLERGLNDTTTQTEDEVEGRLLLDVCGGQRVGPASQHISVFASTTPSPPLAFPRRCRHTGGGL